MYSSTHTTVLFAIILVFVFTVYATSDKIGSPSNMHALLTRAAEASPVSGNAHGSYVTMRSKNGLIFGIINVIGNFATVFQDQAVSTLSNILVKEQVDGVTGIVLATGHCFATSKLRQGISPRRSCLVCYSIHVLHDFRVVCRCIERGSKYANALSRGRLSWTSSFSRGSCTVGTSRCCRATHCAFLGCD